MSEPLSYKTVSQVSGPLLFVEKVQHAAYGEMVEVTNALGSGSRVRSSTPAPDWPSSRSSARPSG